MISVRKNKKSFITIFLCLFTVLFSVFPISVFAEDIRFAKGEVAVIEEVLGEDSSTPEEHKAVLMLYFYNILEEKEDKMYLLYRYRDFNTEEGKEQFCKELLDLYQSSYQEEANKTIVPIIKQQIEETGAYIFYDINIKKTETGTYKVVCDIVQNEAYELFNRTNALPYGDLITEKAYFSLKSANVNKLSLIEEDFTYIYLVSEFEVDEISQISAFLGIPDVLAFATLPDKETGEENLVVVMNSDLSLYDDNQKEFLKNAVLSLSLESPDTIVANMASVENFSSSERNVYSWLITPDINNNFVFRFEEKSDYERYFHVYVILVVIFYSVGFFIIKKYIDYKRL